MGAKTTLNQLEIAVAGDQPEEGKTIHCIHQMQIPKEPLLRRNEEMKK